METIASTPEASAGQKRDHDDEYYKSDEFRMSSMKVSHLFGMFVATLVHFSCNFGIFGGASRARNTFRFRVLSKPLVRQSLLRGEMRNGVASGWQLAAANPADAAEPSS
jgi:hypothetical protein